MSEAARVKVYSLTGDDHADDPAPGIEPVYAGSIADVVTWLCARQGDASYSVVLDDGSATWADDCLSRQLR